MVPAPTLSAILPNYNHGRLLPRAIAALLAQERPPDEIIVIDDGSSDDSRAIIERIAARNPSVRVLLNETNRGAIPTLNRGLDAAKGNYVYMAAADDWVLPGFFKLALDTLATNPDAGLFCGESVLVDSTINRPFAIRPAVRPAHRSRFVSAAQAVQLLKRCDNWILTGSSVFRRECVARAGSLDQSLGSFADGIMARKIALTHGFFFVPQVVACWAVQPASYSRRTALNLDQARHFLNVIPARLAQDPAFPAWYPALFAKRWRFATSRLALEAAPFDYALITAMGARFPLDLVALKTIWAMPSDRLARLATLAWLWLRLRPTSLLGLARTALAGRMRRLRQSKQMAALGRAAEIAG
jgi:glycosyltransferase involved in cell wall biosynthesis